MPLITSVALPDWGSSELIVVNNGSFLLNLPLVNREHRKLADALVTRAAAPRRVFFLESGPSGILILDKDPDEAYLTGMEMFTVWPLGVIVMHLVIAGIALLFAYFPIFGRPRSLEPPPAADFGRHVAAVGELLERTGDRDYALQRLRTYHEHVRGDAGGSRSVSPFRQL